MLLTIDYRWVILLILLLPGLVYSQMIPDQDVQVGRYSTVPAEPSPEQTNLLSAMVTMDFAEGQVNTVGQAVHHLLQQSGYRLAKSYASDPAVQILLTRPMPQVQRHLGPCPLEDALTTLAGPVYRLVVDPLHRLISFEVSHKYQALVQDAAYRPVVSKRWAKKRRRTMPLPTAFGQDYGPVQTNDTLLPIANAMRRGTNATREQMMLALLAANPNAFGTRRGEPNLNHLRVGAVLKSPAVDAWQGWSVDAAKAEVKRHHQLWRQLK